MKAYLLCLLLLPGLLRAAHPEAGAIVVLYNEADPGSLTLAAAYAEKRGIPFDRLVGLSTPVQETISREEYEATIAAPLRKIFVERGWWKGTQTEPIFVTESTLRYAVLMRGLPLRIAPSGGPVEGDQPNGIPKPLARNEASVDSELAMLGFGKRQITGPVENPFFRSTRRIGEANLPGLLLVCRLDAPSPATVHRMINDAVQAEKTGLWGFAYIDSRNLPGKGGMAEGDEWLRNIVKNSLRKGTPVIHENTPQIFAGDYPMRHAALYFGWYTEHVAGPFASERFRFVPGAVAVHIHSFSARTLRDPKRNWCGPLLERGAAATLGNVFEPYLGFTPHLDIFEERLRQGYTFAEAAYASQSALSWMSTFLGDPLYRPFANAAGKGAPASAAPWLAYREGALRWFGENRGAGLALLRQRGTALKSGVVFEGLASLQLASRDPAGAIASLQQARAFYRDEADQVRCTLHTAGLLFTTGKKKEALALARAQLAATPQADGAKLLRQLITQLDPPPKPAATPGGKK